MAKILDYSLRAFKVPGLHKYVPPFGEKKPDGAGLTTAEITRNVMMPFMAQRPINGPPFFDGGDPFTGVIVEDAVAKPIEFNAAFAVGKGVTLQLDDPAYESQMAMVVASFTEGKRATIIAGVAGSPKEISLVPNDTIMFVAVNGRWKTFTESFNELITAAASDFLQSQMGALLLRVRPVGSIYMSVNNESPADIFGGVWTRWGRGRVPAGVNEADKHSEFDTAEKQGGYRVHLLKQEQMPAHTHEVWIPGHPRNVTNDSHRRNREIHLTATGYSQKSTNAGSDQPHNNLQPYITCYMWKRTA